MEFFHTQHNQKVLSGKNHHPHQSLISNARALPSLYAQNGVAVQGLILDSGYTIKSSYEKASLTLGLPLFYRDGDYAQPNGYTILGKAQLSAGVMLKARFELPYFDLITSFGNLGATNVTLLQLGYTF